MTRKFLCLLIFQIFMILLCNAAPLNSDEFEAKYFLNRASSRLNDYYDRMSYEKFSVEDKNFGELLNTFETMMATANAIVNIVKESKEYDVSKFRDAELRYVFKKIRRSAGLAVLGGEQYLDIFSSLDALGDLSIDKFIYGYRNESVRLSYFPDIQNIFAKSNDAHELKYYWSAWRDKSAFWAVENFADLVKGIVDAANLTEITPLEFWLREYNIEEMEQVMREIQPIYLQLHAFIRQHLLKKYGELVISPHGPIPDHLFQQVLAQAWTDGSVIEEMYPHRDLPPYDIIIKQNNFDTLELFKTADRFYQSLGFEKIPDEFWGTRFKMSKIKDEGDCQATIFDKTPNVYMQYCQRMDFRKFLQVHGYMGRIYYAREKAGLPAYYFPSYDLEYPVGESVILSASSPNYLTSMGIVHNFRFTHEVLMNRLLRMGIHTLLNIPVFYVHTKVMADLLSGEIEISDINIHYWKLMDEHVGVEPPTDRIAETLDFPFKFYVDLNDNLQAKKFNSEILGYQFFKRLCEISGQYPQESLQHCNFYGSKRVGDALKKMMKLGSSKPFREVLAVMFPGNTKVSAESLLEYYSPVRIWLNEKNYGENVKLGWTRSQKRIGNRRY